MWFPLNYLRVESVLRFHSYYGDEFTVECPVGPGQLRTLPEVARELATHLARIFLRDCAGRRAVFGGCTRMQTDPHSRDYVLFHEYFDRDTGRGVGASHQTGWTGLVASLLHMFPEIRGS